MHYESIQKKSIISFRAPQLKYFYIYKPALPVTAVKCIFFRKHKLTYIKTMSSQDSIPSFPSSIMEKISSQTISDIVKEFNMKEFIDYLEKKDLKLKESHFKILRKEEITSLAFFKLTKEDFHSIGFV